MSVADAAVGCAGRGWGGRGRVVEKLRSWCWFSGGGAAVWISHVAVVLGMSRCGEMEDGGGVGVAGSPGLDGTQIFMASEILWPKELRGCWGME